MGSQISFKPERFMVMTSPYSGQRTGDMPQLWGLERTNSGCIAVKRRYEANSTARGTSSFLAVVIIFLTKFLTCSASSLRHSTQMAS